MADSRLSAAQRQHLDELLDGPYWRPEGSGQWRTAWALRDKGYLDYDPSRGVGRPFTLTAAGRERGERERAKRA